MHVNFASSSQSNQSIADTNVCADHLISTKQRKSKHVMVHLSHIYSFDSNQNFLPNPLYTRLFNFHKKKQNQNTPVNMISPCMDLCLDNLICMKQNKIKPTLNVKKSLLHHTPVKLFASCTNGCTNHLIST